MKKLILVVIAMFAFTGLAIAGDAPDAACKKQAEEKKLAGPDAEKFVKECMAKPAEKK